MIMVVCPEYLQVASIKVLWDRINSALFSGCFFLFFDSTVPSSSIKSNFVNNFAPCNHTDAINSIMTSDEFLMDLPDWTDPRCKYIEALLLFIITI